MIGRRTIVGLCMLCALLLGAIAAQSASAATNGTTGTFPAGTGYTGTVSIEGAGGGTLLHSVIAGINVEMNSTSLTGTGAAESMLAAATEGPITKGEHTSNGTGAITYFGVTVVKPAEKGCKVKTGIVKTNELKATTAGQGMHLKIEPVKGATLAKFEVEGCAGSKTIEALNGVYEVTGSVVASPLSTEITLFSSSTTAQETLKLRGATAGINGNLRPVASPGIEAISASTVETP